ncbi:alpha/beta fold hydrolase [Cellulomonas sp. C5510]|uniref:alpha/beta fold hydrolase n=1 Tax=Cellulomonas sp. C5510 TaxID=2871170 RepID=UPI001C965D32|nr:alpha/beta fold hydrolase [Cellulomonas sp. C5510]QZN84681.1 alpha/beta fold hydrolase [Cellulomonas sp. C5510]
MDRSDLRRALRHLETRDGALTATERLSALVTLWSSLEHLANGANRRPGGFNDWQQLRRTGLAEQRAVRSVLDVVARPPVLTALHCARIAASAVHLAPVRDRRVRAVAAAVNAGTGLLTAPVHHNGGDGSDQVGFFTQALSAVARARPGTRTTNAVLWTLASQATLAYLVSGWVKLAGEPWRRGSALDGVMRTRTYGAEPVYRIVHRHPVLARAGEIGTLALECGFPAVFLPHRGLRVAYLGAVAGMHASIAGVMGLGRFLPAFLALQPAVLYTAGTAPGRDDTLPRVLGATALAGAGAAACAQLTWHRAARRPRAGQRLVPTTSGSRLAVRYSEGTDPTAPLLVFENSLVATQEYWDALVQQLGGAYATLTYDRPGYGASTAGRGPALADHARDLDDLVERYRRGREVWLVGHSLGGFLALEAADALRTAPTGLVLLDPTARTLTPDGASAVDQESMDTLTASFPLMERSLRAGWGAFLSPRVWAIPASPGSARRIAAVYRDPGIWRAGRLEWRAATARILAPPAPARRPAVPALVLTASTSAALHPAATAAHRGLAERHPDGEHLVVRGTHDGLLTAAGPVAAVAEHIRRFVDDLSARRPWSGAAVAESA